VFPELRERCKKRKINLVEVDLRWGVTEEDTVNYLFVNFSFFEATKQINTDLFR
jgi:hypothetical protein